MSDPVFVPLFAPVSHMRLDADFGVFIGPDGKQSRTPQVEWPATPEDLGEFAS